MSRIEFVNRRHLLRGVALPPDKIKVGQTWAVADATDFTVTIDEIKGEGQLVWIYYTWQRPDGRTARHAKDWFSFQCRYCLVLETPVIPMELLA